MINTSEKQYPERVTRLVATQFLTRFPEPLFNRSAELFLNQLFKQYREGGELDFLEKRYWKIEITDMSRSLFIHLDNGRLKIRGKAPKTDLAFKGPLTSFITLALKEQDPDSLFFNRQLSIVGDTALGLEIKNFIDRIPLEEIAPFPLPVVLRQLSRAFNNAQPA